MRKNEYCDGSSFFFFVKKYCYRILLTKKIFERGNDSETEQKRERQRGGREAIDYHFVEIVIN